MPRAPLALVIVMGWPSFTHFPGEDTEALGALGVRKAQDTGLVFGTQNPALPPLNVVGDSVSIWDP